MIAQTNIFFENRLIKSDRKMVSRLAFEFNFFFQRNPAPLHTPPAFLWPGEGALSRKYQA